MGRKELNDKLYKNALITERLTKLTHEERQKVVAKLLVGRTQRGLAEELGIPHSTLHDWVSLRQDNKGNNIHVSLPAIIRKLDGFEPSSLEEWGYITRIQKIVNKILEVKK